MDTTLGIITALTAVYMLLSSQIANIKNLEGAIWFKFIPLILGLACLFCSLVIFGLLRF